jgi:hypothetical protein
MDVLQEYVAFIFRMEIILELGTSAVTVSGMSLLAFLVRGLFHPEVGRDTFLDTTVLTKPTRRHITGDSILRFVHLLHLKLLI